MTREEQLARIAAAAPPPRVVRVLLERGFETWQWLCADCLERRRALGWNVKQTKPPPHPLRCDDCETGVNP